MPRVAAVEKGAEKRLKNPLATAVAHPLRTRCLSILAERVASPAQIARQLKQPVNSVGYHVTALAEANLVEKVGERPVRGATEHFYMAIEAPMLDAQQEAELEPDERRPFAESIVSIFAGDTIRALDEKTLVARTDHHLTRYAFDVDEAGWEEMTAAYMELYERVMEIKADAAERIEVDDSDEGVIPIVSFQAMFEVPPPPTGVFGEGELPHGGAV